VSGRVVSLGNAVVDVALAVPSLPRRGDDVLADGAPEAGGGGLRAVLAARGAGAEALFAGRIGTGPFGDLIRAALRRADVAMPLAPVAEADSGIAITLVEPDGERSFVTTTGAELADPDLDGLTIGHDDAVHVSGYGLQEPGRAAAVGRFVAGLPESVTVLLDPGPFGVGSAPPALLGRIDWWSGTAAEAGGGDPERAAAALAARVRRGAVVRLGADGCVLAERRADPVRLPAPAVRVRSTNGAGDTHVGTFLAHLVTGADPIAAAVAATAAASAFVAR